MKENSTTSKVTIDDLAVMIAKGFKETNGNLSAFKIETNERFDALESKFDHLEYRFDSLEETVSSDHGRRLRKIENKLQLA